MNTIKKILGLVWIVGGLALAVCLPYLAFTKLTAPVVVAEDIVFWSIVIIIFTPIIIGFVLFGIYALKGEYSEA